MEAIKASVTLNSSLCRRSDRTLESSFLDNGLTNNVLKAHLSRVERTFKQHQLKATASAAISTSQKLASEGTLEKKSLKSQPFQERSVAGVPFDTWLQGTVVEIVRRLKNAPFLYLVFDNNRSGQESLWKSVPSEALENPDSWSSIKDTVLENSPDAVVLVHRLEISHVDKCYGKEYNGACLEDGVGGEDLRIPTSNLWGLVIQEKRSKRHACYILKTTQVSSLSGSWTSFSLTRAKCFGAALHKQLESSWLV